MTTLLTQNIAEMTARIDEHRAADLLVQGEYYDRDTGRGCFIGCLAHDNNPSAIADRYGIPLPLTRVLERIFESLPKEQAAEFFSAIPRAIGEDRKDLTLVVWAFLAETLEAMPRQSPDLQAVIDTVIAGMRLKAEGKNWPAAAAARAAARAAPEWAAEAAEAAAEWAAEAAEWAAEAAEGAAEAAAAAAAAEWAAEAAAVEVNRQRDIILLLMREAPVA